MLNEPLKVVSRAPAAVLLLASHHRRPLRSLHGLKLVLLAIGYLAQVAMILLSSLHRYQKTGMRSMNNLFRNLVLDCSPVTMYMLNFLEMLDVGRSCPLYVDRGRVAREMEIELLFSEVSAYQGLVLGQVFWVLEVEHLARNLGYPSVGCGCQNSE
jgi:hypothetical protein